MESIFAGKGLLSSLYWIGLEKPTGANTYFWQDGTMVNNGYVSNANPCEGTPGW